jgi:uracil-DNA glycosylase
MEYLRQIREEMGSDYEIPFFDPLDGGVQARALFLLEAPGPKAVASGFISRNNPDPTARNFCNFLSAAGIPRRDTLIWNIVPWYVGDGEGRIRPVNKNDIHAALPHLESLLAILNKLEVIVLIGKKAQSVAPEIKRLTDVSLAMTHHPSARVFNVWPKKRLEAEFDYAQVAATLNSGKAMPLPANSSLLS